MGNPFKPMTSGDSLPQSKRFWNRVRQGAEAAKLHRDAIWTPDRPWPDRGEVFIKNGDVSSHIPQYCVLGIAGIEIAHADNADEFKRIIVLTGREPDYPTDVGNFAITLEAIPVGEYGRALISGVVQVSVEVIEPYHTYADVGYAESNQLRTCNGGTAKILWREPGDSGAKWAVVQLGEQPARSRYFAQASQNWSAAINSYPYGMCRVKCYPQRWTAGDTPGPQGTFDTGTTIPVYLWTPYHTIPENDPWVPAHPNVIKDQVIEYQIGTDGLCYCTSAWAWDGVIGRTIREWNGDEDVVPDGWELCDGGSGRPDHRGRVTMGYAEGGLTADEATAGRGAQTDCGVITETHGRYDMPTNSNTAYGTDFYAVRHTQDNRQASIVEAKIIRVDNKVAW